MTPHMNPTSRRMVLDLHNFLPLPESFLKQLGWTEGTALFVELIGDSLLVTKAPTTGPRD